MSKFWREVNRCFFTGHLDESAIEPVGGGDICQSFRLRHHNGTLYFAKRHSSFALLKAELMNLRALSRAPVKTPDPLGCQLIEGQAVLVMEYLPLQEKGDEYQLGRAVANMHAVTSVDGLYGFDGDNFIGHSLQRNRRSSNWAEFWWSQRLQPQLLMARKAGFTPVGLSELRRCCLQLLSGHQPHPSLLHGDLWAGNKAFLPSGEPVLFDPATYYGDRETDLAFTRVFGGFGEEFYRGYADQWALPAGALQRQPLYNLYHMLNHYNLFGAGYAASVEGLLVQLGVM